MNQSTNAPAVTVVIAAYNEGPVIGDVTIRARKALPNGEVLVVDDGSTDDTKAAAEAAGARVVRLPVNQGKGIAVRRGLAEATGEIIVLIDGDGQDDALEIPLLLEALQSGVDLVVGSRFTGVFKHGAITPLNKWGNQFLTRVINFLFGCELTDTQAGFKAFRRAFLPKLTLTAHRFDIEVDLLLGILRAGGRVVEVPVSRAPREHSVSRLDSFRDGTRILIKILRRRFL